MKKMMLLQLAALFAFMAALTLPAMAADCCPNSACCTPNAACCK